MPQQKAPTTHKLKALIADDERLARERMRRLLTSEGFSSFIEVLPQEASNGHETLNFVTTCQPDILFLDIHMPDAKDTTLAQQIQQQSSDKPPAIIYCTAYDHHAVDAFRVGAADYLLKPIQRDQLKEAVERVRQTLRANKTIHASEPIMLETPSTKGTEYIHSDSIICLHAEEKYTRIYHHQGSSLLSISLKTLENQLPDSFIRIHRKTLVALPAIQALEKQTDHLWHVQLRNIENTFMVSRRCLSSLKQAIKAFRSDKH